MAFAKQLIGIAVNAGADAVKFQSFRTDEFMADKKLKYKYKTFKGIKIERMYRMIKRLEFKNEWY